MSKYIESTIKGCISIISKDYVNKFLKLYQPKQSISNIIYLDASNLYGHSRMQLPLSEIGKTNPKQISHAFLLNFKNYSTEVKNIR